MYLVLCWIRGENLGEVEYVVFGLKDFIFSLGRGLNKNVGSVLMGNMVELLFWFFGFRVDIIV